MRKNIQIIDAVRKGKNSFSKKDIHKVTGMAWGTMCKEVDALLSAGYIFQRKVEPKRRGRPVIPLCTDNDSAFFMGLDIGASQTKMVVCNLEFTTVYWNTVDTLIYQNEKDFLEWLFNFIETGIYESRVPRSKLFGVGVAVSGSIDSKKGVIVSGGNFGMKRGTNLPIVDELKSRFGIPGYTITTQAAAAWAEYHFGLHAGDGNIVTIGLGVGIGSGVVANHHLLVSQPDKPIGYIGHVLIPGNEYLCVCGLQGCLEAYSGGNNLKTVAEKQIPEQSSLHSAHALDEAAALGEVNAIKILSLAASYNAVGIVNMIQLYSPDAVIFSGRQCCKEGFLFNKTIEAISDILSEERRKHFTIDISILGTYQSAIGAARLVYETYF